MADVGGPTSRLPGAHLTVPPGATCDDHNDRPAVKRIQGETDSFGYEAYDMCQECYDKYVQEANKPRLGHCDRCSSAGVEVHHTRDPEEGSCGPVYQMCSPCKSKMFKAFNDDLEYD